MKNRILSVFLAAVLVLTTLGTGNVKAYADTGLTTDNMSALILSTKEKLNVGDEYTEFEYDFYDYGTQERWYFNWRTKNNEKTIYAYCDRDGHVQDFSSYGQDEYSSSGKIPAYTREELLPEAKKYIERIGGKEISGHIYYDSARTNTYQGTYTYAFYRTENGIPMNDNSVTITLKYGNGTVSSYSANWNYDAEIPAAKDLITEAEAKNLIDAQLEMKLAYRIGYKDGKAYAFLYYEPDKTYIAVDAVTSKIYDQKSYWERANGAAANDMLAEADTVSEAKAAFSLSEAELSKIDEIKDIISSERAIEIVKSYDELYFDENLNTVNTYLQASGGSYVWRVTMKDSRPVDWENNDYYRASLQANVDAKTGELKYFYASLQSYLDKEDGKEIVVTKYSEDECRKNFESFAKHINPDRFKDTVKTTAYPVRVLYLDPETNVYTYGAYDFRYARINEGAMLDSNSFSGTVDAVSGKITSYSYYWNDDVELPSTKGVIGEGAAFNAYMSLDGFGLNYEIASRYEDDGSLYGYTRDEYVRLVYSTNISPAYIDAFTGKQINYNGEEYSEKAVNLEYTDIEGHKYERQIKLLASMGIGFETENFRPDDVITRDEFQQLADMYGNFYVPDELKIKGENKLTRRYAARAVVNYLGYSDIAKLKIYTTGYSDEDKITDSFLGSVALAKGFGIMDAVSGKKFKPTTSVTRGEAADILLKAISAKK